MKFNNLAIILSIPLLLSACTNNHTRPAEMKEIFATDIKPSGLKIFSYSVTMGIPDESSRGSGSQKGKGRNQSGSGMQGGMSSGRPSRESMIKGMSDKLHQMLNLKLAHNGYCREGYIELDIVMGRGHSQIRGECNEGATESDQMKFSGSKDA